MALWTDGRGHELEWRLSRAASLPGVTSLRSGGSAPFGWQIEQSVRTPVRGTPRGSASQCVKAWMSTSIPSAYPAGENW
jgi:hypothetical protein